MENNGAGWLALSVARHVLCHCDNERHTDVGVTFTSLVYEGMGISITWLRQLLGTLAAKHTLPFTVMVSRPSLLLAMTDEHERWFATGHHAPCRHTRLLHCYIDRLQAVSAMNMPRAASLPG